MFGWTPHLAFNALWLPPWKSKYFFFKFLLCKWSLANSGSMCLGVFSSQAICGHQLPPSWQPAVHHLVPGTWPHCSFSTPAIPTVSTAAFHPVWQPGCVVLWDPYYEVRLLLWPFASSGAQESRGGLCVPQECFSARCGWQQSSLPGLTAPQLLGGRGGLARERPLACPQPRYWTCPRTEAAVGFETHRLLQESAARRRGPWLEGLGPGAWQDLYLPCEYPLSREITLNSKLKNTTTGQESKCKRKEKLHIVP